MTSKLSSQHTPSTSMSAASAGARLQRFHSHQLRADRLNYVAIALGLLVGLYVAVTIVRPLFFGTRPGKVTQDFGCISKSTVSDCSASSR